MDHFLADELARLVEQVSGRLAEIFIDEDCRRRVTRHRLVVVTLQLKSRNVHSLARFTIGELDDSRRCSRVGPATLLQPVRNGDVGTHDRHSELLIEQVEQ